MRRVLLIPAAVVALMLGGSSAALASNGADASECKAAHAPGTQHAHEVVPETAGKAHDNIPECAGFFE